jgi:hypothetical protein
MTTVSCPKCSDQVSVPASAPRSARVRCPLCQDEYDLADALAQLPPALIIVDAGVADEPVLAAVGGMDAATCSHIGSALDHGFDSHVEGGAAKGYSVNVLEAEPSHAEMVSAPTPSFRSSPRPKRKEKSMVGELVKIVLGGVVGISLAIVILWWGPGVDLGLAPTISKVNWMRWVLPQKILDKVEGNQGNKEENPGDLQPINIDNGDNGKSKPSQIGKSEGGVSTSGGGFAAKAKPKTALKTEDPLDVSEPFAEKSTGGVGELKIESPLTTELKPVPKKPEPAKTNTSEEPSEDDPFKPPAKPEPAKPIKPAEPTEPVDEKPAEKPAAKPKEENPAKESPAPEKPKEETSGEKPAEKPAESAAAAANLADGIDAANSAAKAFDDTDAEDKEARKTAVVALYNAYAGLGRTVEQTNLEDADNAEKLPALRQTLAELAKEPFKFNSIGFFAGKKLDAADGDPGILLAGTVKDLKAAGGHFETTVELVRDKRLVTVISAKNPQDSYKIDDQVLILGSIVREPKEKLPGYQGEAAVLVKSGHAMVVPTDKP